MITVKEKIRLIEACFGKSKISNDNKNIVVFCPLCKAQGKDKFKLAIGIEKGMYHCWVCEAKGKNIGSLALKHSMQKKSAKDLYTYYKKDKGDERLRIDEEEVITLPEDFRLVTADRGHGAKVARAYLEARGFTQKDIWRFKIGISDEYGYKNRVIFPSFDHDQNLNFFTARSVDPNNKRRYKNCKTSRKEVIFNEFELDFSQPMIIVEGVFDLVNCPENSTCLLGSWLDQSYKLFTKIVRNKTPVTLCLDADALLKTQKISKLLHEYCIDVKISQNKSNKDFSDMTKSEVKYWIDSAKCYDNVNRMTYLINEIKSGSMF
tara:strand:- start:6741 stop:7700 length:960 start_codon:yes stop_codon:yes gene_type:complete